MRVELKQRYVTLVKYLSELLGPSYEIALHDLSLEEGTIIAIANGHITDRTVGDGLTPKVKKFIEDKKYLSSDYEVNFMEKIHGDRTLRTSTLYIMDDLEVVGLLCITFDDILYRNIAQELMRLCRPDYLQSPNFKMSKEIYREEVTTNFTNLENNIQRYINYIRKKYAIGTRKLSKEEKLQIVGELKEKGIFDIKGAVEETCQLIDVSISTIYRYLREIESKS